MGAVRAWSEYDVVMGMSVVLCKKLILVHKQLGFALT